MVASLKFESATGIEATNLQDTRIVTLEDTGGSTYTLDITTNDLKVEYTPTGGQKVEKIINGLAAALGKLLTIDGSTAGKSVLAEEVAKKPVVDALIPELAKDDGTTGIYTKKGVDDELAKKADTSAIPAAPDLSNYLETSKLAEEVAKKPVVEAIFDLEDNGAKISETKIGTTFAKKTDLDNKADANGTNLDDAKVTAILEKLTDKVVKTSELSAKAADKAVAEAIFDAKDNQKSILVEKLGGFLDAPETPYGAQGDQAAKDFLGKKGLKPLPSEVASELIANNKQDLANEVANNPGLQTAVANNPGLKAVLAKPVDIAAIPALQEAVAKNADLQEAVAKNGDLQKAVAAIPALQTAVAENVDLQEAVAENVDFREAVAMDADLRTAVAADAGLQAAVAENEDLQKALAAIPALQTAVANNADLKAILAKPADIAAIPALQTAVAADAGLRTAVAENKDLHKALAAIPALQNAVAHNADLQNAIIPQSSFEIPEDPTVALSWD